MKHPIYQTMGSAALALACLLTACMIGGCGAGGGSQTQASSGRATFVIKWPSPTRLIPAGTESIKIVITAGGQPISSGTKIINAPAIGTTTTTVFPNLPVGALIVTATAYAQPDAMGVALATGTANLQIVPNANTTVTLTLGSTIDHISVTAIGAASSTLVTGQIVQVVATAFDASGAVVPIGAGSLTWTSSNPAVAAINPVLDSSGNATAVASVVGGSVSGLATLTASYQETDSSGVNTSKLGTLQVTVISSNGTTGARYAYVVNSTAGTLTSYQVDPNTGALTASGAAQATGAGASAVAVDSTGRFVYVANTADNTISAYVVTSVAGGLTPLAAFTGNPFPAGGGPVALVIAPNSEILYAVDSTTDTISTFSIDPNNGSLTQTSTPVSTGAVGKGAVSLVVDPSGRFVYAADKLSGNIAEFTADTNTGALTLSNSAAAAGAAGPIALAVDPSGHYLFAANATTGALSVYMIDSGPGGTGSLTQTSTAMSTGSNPAALVVSGSYLFVANSLSNTVQVYTFQNGGLFAVGQAVSTGLTPDALAVDPTGRFLYVTNNKAGTVSTYSIDPGSGSLTPIAAAPVSTGAGPSGIAVVTGSTGSATVSANSRKRH